MGKKKVETEEKKRFPITYSWWGCRHGMLEDPRVLMIARKHDLPMAHVALIWARLHEYASGNEPRGSIADVDPDAIGFFFDIEGETVSAIIRGAKERGLVDSNDFIVDWPDDQNLRRVSSSTERVRKYRKNKVMSDNETPCNADVTNVTHETPKALHETQETQKKQNVTLPIYREGEDTGKKEDKELRKKTKTTEEKGGVGEKGASSPSAPPSPFPTPKSKKKTKNNSHSQTQSKIERKKQSQSPPTNPEQDDRAPPDGGEVGKAKSAGAATPNDHSTPETMRELWAEILGETNPVARSPLSEKHKILLEHARASFPTLADWREYLEHMAVQPFLTGAAESGWRATLAWAAHPDNIRAVLAGEYRAFTAKTPDPPPDVSRVAAARAPTLEELGSTPHAAQFLLWLELVAQRVGGAAAGSWFYGLRPLGLVDGVLTITAPSRFIAQWVPQHYGTVMAVEAQRVWPWVERVDIVPARAGDTRKEAA